MIGKIDIDCQDEKDRIIIGLARQLDIYNSNDLSRLIDTYIEISFKKFVINLEKPTYLDCFTISTFLQFFQILKEEGRFVLASLHDDIKKYLSLPSSTMFSKSFVMWIRISRPTPKF